MTWDRTASNPLSSILPRVSRSFYLSLRVLPRSIRQPIGLAYLFCRAADTIADTPLLPRDQRLTILDQYRTLFDQGNDRTLVYTLQPPLMNQQCNPAERALLMHIGDCFAVLTTMEQAEQSRLRELVLTLTQGMHMDLTAFPGEGEGKVGALATRSDLDRYTYYVAGCVGEFWTKTLVAHCPALQHWDMSVMTARGTQFGKGLQLTNILRDVAHDLRLGRCYLPREDLAALGVQPEELFEPASVRRIQPLLDDLLALTLAYYQAGWTYTLAVPRRQWRVRLACAWPLLIGISTLTLIRHSPRLLDPAVRLKIARARVYRIMLRSVVTVWSDWALGRYYAQLYQKGLA